jgi:hypothetical protein
MIDGILQLSREQWIWVAAGVGVVAGLLLLAGWWWWRGREATVASAIRAVSVDAVHDVLVPDGMGGHIHLAHLLLTARGLVIVDVKRFRGVVFGSDRMEEWTVIAEKRRFTFPNPQSGLYDRLAALRQVARDVPVAGHVVFERGADFSKGRPKDVLLPAELQELYRKPASADLKAAIELLEPQWEQVKRAIRRA